MPIVINLLAEEQAAEEQRRRDPVKKATFIAIGVVGLVVLWALLTLVRLSAAKGELDKQTAAYAALEDQEKAVKEDLKATKDAEGNLAALHRLVTNRFIWAPALDALQFTIPDGVVVFRVETSQTYAVDQGIPPRPKDGVKGRPASSVEQISFTIHATDFNNAYSDFIEKISNHPYFKEKLKDGGQVKLLERSRPQEGMNGQQYRSIVIECEFPKTERKE